MNRTIRRIAVLCFFVGAGASSSALAQEDPARTAVASEIIALERAALDLFVVSDPKGYLDLYAPDVTYFDPYRERRVDGLEAMTELFDVPEDAAESSPAEQTYELIHPKVQDHGDVVILTFNFIGFQEPLSAPGSRWNATEIYRLIDGDWKIIHSHWSYTTPELETDP